MITEKIYENRMHVAELQRMGASIRLQGNTAVIEGVSQLSAALLWGVTRVLLLRWCLQLTAKGTSKVSGLNHLDRGYDARRSHRQWPLESLNLQCCRASHNIDITGPGGIGRRS